MKLELRAAEPGDVELLYRWANDPVTRQNAFHEEQIPYETHKKWFADRLADRDTLIYIAMEDTEPVGQLRYQISGDEALISYSVDAENRGRGIGTELLRAAAEQLHRERPEVKLLRGEVKYGNKASRRAFEKNGYAASEHEEFVEFERKSGS